MRRILMMMLLSLSLFLMACNGGQPNDFSASDYDMTEIASCINTNFDNLNDDACDQSDLQNLMEDYLEDLWTSEYLDGLALTVNHPIITASMSEDMSESFQYTAIVFRFTNIEMAFEEDLYQALSEGFLQLRSDLLSVIDNRFSLSFNLLINDVGIQLEANEQGKEKDWNHVTRRLIMALDETASIDDIASIITTYQTTPYADHYWLSTDYLLTLDMQTKVEMAISPQYQSYRLRAFNTDFATEDLSAKLEGILEGYELDVY